MTAAVRPHWRAGCATALGVIRRDLSIQRSYGWVAAAGLASGLLGLVVYFFIARLVDGAPDELVGGDYFAFVVSGLILFQTVAVVAGSVANGFARDASEGTLEIAIAAGAPVAGILAGAATAALLLASIQMAAYGAAAWLWLLRGSSGFSPDWIGASVCAALTLIAMLPVGIAGAAVWLATRRAHLFVSGSLALMTLLGGVYFPAELLPAPAAVLASWLPLYIGIDALRDALFAGASLRQLAEPLLHLTWMAALGWCLSSALLRIALGRAERRGSLRVGA